MVVTEGATVIDAVVALVLHKYCVPPVAVSVIDVALQIVESISYDYAMMNCQAHFIIEEHVIPYLKKQNENQRLEIVKGILADGYLDINGNRFYFLHQPYVNFDKDENAKRTRYIEEVPDAK